MALPRSGASPTGEPRSSPVQSRRPRRARAPRYATGAWPGPGGGLRAAARTAPLQPSALDHRTVALARGASLPGAWRFAHWFAPATREASLDHARGLSPDLRTRPLRATGAITGAAACGHA